MSTRTRTLPKTTMPTCTKCADLDLTPSFLGTIISVHKLTDKTVKSWYHKNGHNVVVK